MQGNQGNFLAIKGTSGARPKTKRKRRPCGGETVFRRSGQKNELERELPVGGLSLVISAKNLEIVPRTLGVLVGGFRESQQ